MMEAKARETYSRMRIGGWNIMTDCSGFAITAGFVMIANSSSRSELGKWITRTSKVACLSRAVSELSDFHDKMDKMSEELTLFSPQGAGREVNAVDPS